MAAREEKPNIDDLMKQTEAELASVKERTGLESQISRLTAKIRRLEQQNSHLKKEAEEFEKVGEFMSELADNKTIHQWDDREEKTDKSPQAALAILSDWHVEETVDPATVNGRNEYNLEIAHRRAQRIFQKIADYVERYTPAAQVLYLGLLGDFINGYLRDEDRENNSLHPIAAGIEAQDMLCAGIEVLRRRNVVKKIICPTAVGNHARTTKRTHIATRVKNNYEWGLYQQLSRTYSSDPFVDILVCAGYHTYTEIFGRMVRWHHGDAINYQGGVGGPTIPILKKIYKWNDSRLRAELDLFGHLHQYIPGRSFVLNSSMIGYNSFAIDIGAAEEPPNQAFIGFSKARGAHFYAQMFAEEHTEHGYRQTDSGIIVAA